MFLNGDHQNPLPALIGAALVLGGCAVEPGRVLRDAALRDLPAPAAQSAHGGGDTTAGAAASLPARLSLEDAVRIALDRNPDMRAAVVRVRRAKARLDEAAAAFFPSFAAETGYVRADAPSSFLFKSIDARALEPGTDFNEPGSFENFESGFTARWNLFNGGRDLLERWIARAGHEASELDRDAARNALVAAVIVAYHDVLMAAEMVGTARASAETVAAQLRETEAKWREGRVLRSDVLSLEVRLAEARERVIRAENSRALGTAALANLLGAGADTAFELGGEAWESGAPDRYEDALPIALARRPELRRAGAMVERSAFELAAARSAFLPRLDASARAYWDDAGMRYHADDANWLVAVTLSWTLFEGGGRRARAAGARAAVDELIEADRKAALAVELDVKTAYLRLDEARARLEVAEATVEQATETLELVRTQYREGAVTVTRYLEAELALTEARVRRTQATFDLRKALADAARSAGLFADGIESGPGGGER